MREIRGLQLALGAAVLLLSSSPAFAGNVSEISKDEFYAASYYRQALEDPRIQKLKAESKKIAVVAKDIHVKPALLKTAIAKLESLGGAPEDLASKAIQSALGGGRLSGRVLDVLINAEEPKHVVVYVRWRGSSTKEVIKEASEIAHAVSSQAPFVSTLSLAAIAPKAAATSKEAVWSAKIAADRMASIQPKRIDEYADRLYARLFEVVDHRPF